MTSRVAGKVERRGANVSNAIRTGEVPAVDRPASGRSVLGSVLQGSLLLLLAGVSTLRAQSNDDVVFDTLDVRVVNVDVTVTDGKGEPVDGLTAADFELFEDGEPVEISHFYASRGARREASQAEPAEAESAVETVVDSPLTFAVVLDERNTLPTHFARVLPDLAEFLRGRHLSDASFVLASYRDQLEILTSPTKDVDAVVATMEARARSGFGQGARAERELSATLSAIRDSYTFCEDLEQCWNCVDNWQEMLGFARVYATEEQTQTAIGVSGLADLTAALAARPGRKAVLYVGDGFQMRGGTSTFVYVAQICEHEQPQGRNEVMLNLREFDSNRRLSELTAYANGNRVQFYMLDAGGVRNLSLIEFGNGDLRPSNEFHQLRVENLQSTHHVIARETGGKAILNANRPLDALVDIADELERGTYSLGFVPGHPRSGRIHILDVQLRGRLAKGKRLRFRRSYQDKTVEAELVDDLLAELFVGSTENPLGARVRVTGQKPISRRLHEVDVEVLVPEEAFLQLPAPEGGQRSQARLWMTALSDRGHRADVRHKLLDLGPGGVVAEGGLYAFVVTLQVRRGQQTIALGVRDELGSRQSVLRTVIDVPAVEATSSTDPATQGSASPMR